MLLNAVPGRHDSAIVEQLFAQTFYARLQTRLCGGASEPYYQPANNSNEDHLLFYREDFFASALHEVAHWCIAGQARRLQPDFGYWYVDENRSEAQQRAFEAAECKPQAVERLFSEAARFPFQPSLDQHAADGCYAERVARFNAKVAQQATHYDVHGWPARAEQFAAALRNCFQGVA